MAFFDELSKKLSGVSRVAVRKAKEVTDIGSLKLQIARSTRTWEENTMINFRMMQLRSWPSS